MDSKLNCTFIFISVLLRRTPASRSRLEIRTSCEAAGKQATDEERHPGEKAEDQEEVDKDRIREDHQTGGALQ